MRSRRSEARRIHRRDAAMAYLPSLFLFYRDPMKNFDVNDIVFYVGLAMLFAGLALSVSVGTGLIVVGAVLGGVALTNSYLRIFWSRKS